MRISAWLLNAAAMSETNNSGHFISLTGLMPGEICGRLSLVGSDLFRSGSRELPHDSSPALALWHAWTRLRSTPRSRSSSSSEVHARHHPASRLPGDLETGKLGP